MSNVYWPLYEVFVRGKQGLSHRHVGSLHAADERMALENARDAYTRRSEGCSIWVVKASEIVDDNTGIFTRTMDAMGLTTDAE